MKCPFCGSQSFIIDGIRITPIKIYATFNYLHIDDLNEHEVKANLIKCGRCHKSIPSSLLEYITFNKDLSLTEIAAIFLAYTNNRFSQIEIRRNNERQTKT